MLKNNQNKYYGLFNQIADPIFIFEKNECQILDCNKSVNRIYGYTSTELNQMTFLDLHPPEELERVKKAIKIVNKDIPFTFTHFKKNGKRINVEVLSDQIQYEGRDATVSIVRDVTDRVKIEKELKRRATQATLIYEIGKRVSSNLDQESVLNEIVNSIYDTFDFYGVMLLLLNVKKEQLNLQSIAGGYEGVFPDSLTIKMGEGMIGQAAVSKETQLSNDVTENLHYVKKVEEVTISELSIPIIGKDDVIGVIDFQSDKKNAFDKSDVEVAETLSSQIATAIENARLYNQAQMEIEERLKAENELRQSRNNLRATKKETDTILKNVEEGIFILDKDHLIGSQHSAALCEMLNFKDPAQKKLVDIFKDKVGEKEIENIQDYLDLMFNPDIDEQTLGDLNPLTKVNLNFLKKDELLSTEKVLAFKFQRIMINQKISSLMATVTDITEKVKLAKKLEESEEQSKLQMEWFLGILHVEPQMLKEFIDGATREMDKIEQMFKKDTSENNYLSVLKDIYQSIHLVKGNASLLDLKYFANNAHAFEEKIEGLQDKKSLSARDFIPLVMQLGELRASIGEIYNMIERISQIHTHFRPKRSFENQMMINSIKNLISNLSRDLKKDVQFVHDKFKGEQLPYEYRLLIKDLLIQMVRNSMAHGIESPEERKQNNKAAKGRIEISTFSKNGDFCFKFKDDGQGIKLKKLREAAENSGKWKKNEIDKWDNSQIAELIFEPGISTSETADLNAGRGVGMGAIKESVENNQGKISMNFKEGKFMEFIVNLPVRK